MTTPTRTAGHRVVATAGHVDHGKSTLLRAVTGMEPDRLEEERRRGLSIELGFVWGRFPTPAGDTTIAFVDVPGHERFIATMLAGVGAVAGALFVVAADDGWSAQSEEHLEILDLLAVPGVAVAVTKAGLAGSERTAEVVAEVERRLRGTVLEHAPLVQADAVTGDGLGELAATLGARVADMPSAEPGGHPRLWVDRVFTVAGSGTVVTGTLQGRALAVGTTVRVLPNGGEGRVRALQSLGTPVDAAAAGTRVAVNLGGVDRDAVTRGDVVVAGGDWQVSDTVEVLARALPGRRLEPRGAWHLHVGTAHTTVRVRPLVQPVRPGEPGVVRLRLERPLPLLVGDRVVVREAGRRATVAGGVVVDAAPPRLSARRQDRRRRAETLAQVPGADGPGARLVRLLEAAAAPRPRATVLAVLDWPDGTALPDDVVDAGGQLVHRDVARPWLAAMREVAASGPAQREELVAAAEQAGAGRILAAALVDGLLRRGQLVRTAGGAYALPSTAGQVDDARRRRWARVIAALESDPMAPPDLASVAKQEGLDHREVTALVQSGAVVRCGPVAFSRRAVDDAVARLVALEREVGAFTAAQAKEAWGTTRRYAIPLLEHLDTIGVTRFDGSLRTLTQRATVRLR